MTVNGPQALGALDEALRDIRREEDDILRKLARGLERMAKIRDSEGELLRQFAHGRLAPDEEAVLAGETIRTGLAAQQALKQRAAEIAATGDRLRQLERAFADRTAARAAALGEIDQRQAALRALSPRIAAAIARQADYEQQRQVVLRLKAVAAAARGKCRQADLDREQKGRPYRGDRLFSYLLARGFGTPAYKANWLVARLDAEVARLVGFEMARANYAALNELPARLRAHAEQQAVRATAAEGTLDDLERSAIDAAGGGDIRAGLADAQARTAAIDEELLALQDERDRTVTAQTRLTEVVGTDFDRAVLALVQALGSPDIGSLVGALRVKNAGADDPLAAQLDDNRLRVAEEQIDSRDLHARLKTLAARRRSLEDIEFELKARKFDDPRSLFRDDDLIGTRLDNFLTGAISADTYWSLWPGAQAWSVGTSDWGGGVGLPRHGRDAVEASAARPQHSFSRPRRATAGAGA